jgi:hypothetical protein
MERSMVKYVARKIQVTESELKIAEILVKKELRSKMIMSQVSPVIWSRGDVEMGLQIIYGLFIVDQLFSRGE